MAGGEISGAILIADLVPPPAAMVSAAVVLADLAPPPAASISGAMLVVDAIASSGTGALSGAMLVVDLVGPSGPCPREDASIIEGYYDLLIRVEGDPAAPYDGPVLCEIDSEEILELISGDTGALIHDEEVIVPSGGTLNLSPLESRCVFGYDAEIEEVWFLHIENAGPGDVVIESSSTSPWVELVDGSLSLPSGAKITIRANETTFVPASLGSHRFRIVNNSASDATVTYAIAGATPP